MTPSAHLTWMISRYAYDVPRMLKSDLPQVVASGKVAAERLAIMRALSARIHEPQTLTGTLAAWYRWLLAITPTYDNNPRLNETENTRIRREALEQRDRDIQGTRAAA